VPSICCPRDEASHHILPKYPNVCILRKFCSLSIDASFPQPSDLPSRGKPSGHEQRGYHGARKAKQTISIVQDIKKMTRPLWMKAKVAQRHCSISLVQPSLVGRTVTCLRVSVPSTLTCTTAGQRHRGLESWYKCRLLA